MRVYISLLLSVFLMIFSCGKGQTTGYNVEDKTPCTVLHVVDGDTFQCRLSSGEEVKVRLIGVDTPESSENPKARRDAERTGRSLEEITEMGKVSTEFTRRLLPRGETVYLEFDVQKTDRYGRLLAYVWLSDGSMLNEVLLKEGYATVFTAPPNVKYRERFLQAQKHAVEKRKGLWGM